MKRLSILLIVLLFSVLVAACTTQDPELSEEEVDAYKAEMQTNLDALGEQMTQLRVQAEQAGEEMRPEINAALDELQVQADQLKVQLDSLSEEVENTEAWEDIKAGLNTTWQGLEEGYQQIVNEINEEG
jgi:cytochrome c556